MSAETDFVVPMLRGALNRASFVTRYSSHPVLIKENVAEHSFYVAMYSLILVNECGIRCDLKKLLARALVHDIDESVTGDFQRTFKYGSPELRRALHDGAKAFTWDMLRVYSRHTQATLYHLWDSAKDSDIEGEIILVADFLAVVAYIIREIRMGNEYGLAIASQCAVYANEVINRLKGEHRTLVEVVQRADDELTKAVNTHGPQSNFNQRAEQS